MSYDFKLAAELGWAFLVGVVIALAEALVGFHPEQIADWRAWAIILAGALVRAGAGAALAAYAALRSQGTLAPRG